MLKDSDSIKMESCEIIPYYYGPKRPQEKGGLRECTRVPFHKPVVMNGTEFYKNT